MSFGKLFDSSFITIFSVTTGYPNISDKIPFLKNNHNIKIFSSLSVYTVYNNIKYIGLFD